MAQSGKFRSDQRRYLLENILRAQNESPNPYDLSEHDIKCLKLSVVNSTDRQIIVSVPDDESSGESTKGWLQKEQLESIQMQAKLAAIGERMGLMADLMALQPNLSIQAHIVAPHSRRTKVLQEISRPVFALLERGPLSESCSYLSYDTVAELWEDKNLDYLNDTVLEKYAEDADV